MASPLLEVDISKLADRIRKKFGGESVAVPGIDTDFMLNRIPHWIDTENVLLNAVIGHPERGFPCGFYCELAGPEGNGKSTFGYYLLGKAQRAGALAILADVEHSYNATWAARQGVNNKELLLVESAYQVDHKMVIENADEQFKKWEVIVQLAAAATKRPIFLMVDSLAALMPKEWIEGDYGDRGVAALARAMSQNIPKLQPVMINTKTSVLFVNQFRDKVGVMWGDTEETPGGRTKNYYFWSRVRIVKSKILREHDKEIGIQGKIKNKKNKVAPPFQSIEFRIHFQKGLQLQIPKSSERDAIKTGLQSLTSPEHAINNE